MRIYAASGEEALRARQLLKDWAGEGFLTEAQNQRMLEESACDLRTTNIFLRLVLFFFTLLIVGAAVGLFFEGFLRSPSRETTGVFLLIFAAVCYAGAEFAVSHARLYRHGVEEALAAGSVGLLCAGLQSALFGGVPSTSNAIESLVPAAGAISSLWIWRRFGFAYAFLAAMVFVVFLPGYWTSSHWAQHVIVALFYAAGLAGVSVARYPHRLDYLNDGYSLVEAFLWLGLYLAINLQFSSLTVIASWWRTPLPAEFPDPFYWTTWVLIWCLPAAVLVRALRQRDRWVLAAGAIAATLTLVTNKPYLGWPRNTWDPMILGALFTGVALFLRRWLARGPGGIRRGFTAARLSGRGKEWLSAGSMVFGALAPQPITPDPQAASNDVHFGGGDSGGAGASGDF